MAESSRPVKKVKGFLAIGVTVALATGGFLFAAERLLQALRTDPIVGGLAGGLGVLTLAWFAIYIYNSRAEVDELVAVIDPEKLPAIYSSPLALVVGMAISMGLLLALTWDALFYAVCAVAFQTLHLVGDSMVHQYIYTAQRDRNIRQGADEEAFRIHMAYYLENRTLLRDALILSGFYASLVLSLLARLQADVRMTYIAYGLLILTIGAGELVMARWRSVRDGALAGLKRRGSSPSQLHSTLIRKPDRAPSEQTDSRTNGS